MPEAGQTNVDPPAGGSGIRFNPQHFKTTPGIIKIVEVGLTTCRLCGKVLCIVSHLRRHLAQAHNLGPEQIRLLAPTAVHGAYICVVCGKRYRHQMSLTLHRKVHEGLTICPLCGTVSSKVSHLRRHLENVHRLEQEQIYRLVPSVRARSLPQALAGVDTGHGDGEIADAQSGV
ncbi:Zinc finger protein 596 [Amphibalanus amphitrite]|uniref:Zinc finger protein 596 n=1 Tax=Amphibalanus amphitrite TaxID=1232801 RepID=A0A6A4V3Y6_AMPAM|nr:Zinc finger protein 596 [Amphibalanus amphitrite]